MAIVTVKDLSNQFSATVNEYLNKGYMISPITHGGSYSSEQGHVDLVNPKDRKSIIRVWLLEGYEPVDPNKSSWNTIPTLSITVKEYDWNGRWNSQTLWPNCGLTISDKVYYEVYDKKCYSDSKDEVVTFRHLNYTRCEAREIKSDDYRNIDVSKVPGKFITSIMDRIRSIRGFKRANSNCITKISLQRSFTGKLKAYISYSYNNKTGSIILK